MDRPMQAVEVMTMSLFKKKLPAASLAVVLMDYTLTGELHSGDSGRFALGPNGISVSDGSDVLPDGVKRTHREHLSSRDSLVIALETMYLRGFVVWVLLKSLVKNKQVREAVLESYESFWTSWSHDGGLNYKDFYEKAVQVYSGRVFVSDLGNRLATSQSNPGEQDVSEMLGQIGAEFSGMCDPFDTIRDPLKSELAKRGESVFTETSDAITNLLEGVLEKYRVVAA